MRHGQGRPCITGAPTAVPRPARSGPRADPPSCVHALSCTLHDTYPAAMTAPLLTAALPWLLYRSFFALPKSIADEQGRPVNALLGTVNALLNLLEPGPGALAQTPRAVVACMGAEQADYRVRLYPPYHAHRDPMPPELAHQWGQAPQLMQALGWINATSADMEADDVMFSFAHAEQQHGGQALLLTGDRDLFGAATHSISVLQLGKGGTHELI